MLRSARMIGATLVTTVALGAPVWAGSADYRIEAAGQPVTVGDATLIRLRLVHVPDGKPVTGASLIQPRLEKDKDAGVVTAPVRVTVSGERGQYAVEARPEMNGEWRLLVGAMVPGETAPIREQLALDLVR